MYIGAYIFRPHPIHNIKQEAFSVLSYSDLKTRAETLKNNPSSGTHSGFHSRTTSSSGSNNMRVSIVRGQLIQEVRQEYSSWLTSVVRLERDNPAILFDWTVGPIPVDDDDNGAEHSADTSDNSVGNGEKMDIKKDSDRRLSHKKTDKPNKDHDDEHEEHHHKHSSSSHTHTRYDDDTDDLTTRTRHISFNEGNGGKEIVFRVYAADIHSGDVFYTDANGREFQRRRRNSRETWNLVRLAT